jgi:dihydrofolate synthase/folylpolyglutamate synthase
MVSEEFVIEFTERIKPLIEEIEPSFFEITVAMAFDFFEKQNVDIAIIEVGLGGRLDSTNIITPKLSIITNIGYDHMNILGDTLEKIAAEKAGIIKKNVPVVVGETTPETKSIFKAKAIKENAEIHFAAEKRNVNDWRWENHELIAEVEMQHNTDHKIFHLDLPGIYQTKNILTVLEACSVLKNMNFELNDNAIKTGLQKTKKLTGLHGRWEMIHEHPRVILDVAHNEDGIKQLVSQIELSNYHKLHIITGMVKDKNIDSILSLLPRSAHYYFTQAAIPRALGADILKEKAAQFNLKGEIYSNVNAAVKQAMINAQKEDLILIAGSVFLIGEVAPIPSRNYRDK